MRGTIIAAAVLLAAFALAATAYAQDSQAGLKIYVNEGQLNALASQGRGQIIIKAFPNPEILQGSALGYNVSIYGDPSIDPYLYKYDPEEYDDPWVIGGLGFLDAIGLVDLRQKCIYEDKKYSSGARAPNGQECICDDDESDCEWGSPSHAQACQ